MMNLQEKLDLYFFDPNLDEDLYTKRYCEISEQRHFKKYSPLYLIRRQILLLSGKLIEFPAPPIWQKSHFSAILLANVAISGIIELTTYGIGKKPGYCDYDGFYNNYFGKSPGQWAGLRILRNALEHNNFQLQTCEYRNNSKSFYKTISQKVSLKNPEKIDYFKITFTLTQLNSTYFVSGPALEREDVIKGYALVRYTIDPFRFLEKFDEAVKNIFIDITLNNKLLMYFDSSVTVDNWMYVSNNPTAINNHSIEPLI